MTVSTTTRRVAYNGNGSTTAFAVPFVFFGPTELQVIARASDGTETVLAISTDYTVSGGNGATGTVTAVTAPASGVSWTIIRNTARTQLTDYVPNDPFPAQTHERALDRLTAIAQEVEDGVFNALSFPITEPGPYVLPSRAVRANRFLAFDSAGDLLLVTGVGEGGSGYNFISSAATSYALTVANTSSVAGRRWTRFTAESTITVTIPTNASQAIPIGTEVFFERATATVGTVVFRTAVGVTLNDVELLGAGGASASLSEFSGSPRAHLIKVAANEWWASSEVTISPGLDSPGLG